jgi:alpha-beta hydrolase superfamily lysophospholipase
MTEQVDGAFAGASGGRIRWQGWVPPQPPKGVVVIVHGLAEHGGRYAHVAEHLAAHGYASYAHDHHGHGRSAGTRGNIDRMSHVVTDLETMIRSASGRHAGAPLFLYGHSMGGLIALVYATGDPVPMHGLILTGAAVHVEVGSGLERVAARLLSVIAPNLGTRKLDAALVSRDPAVVRNYESDPLNYRGKVRLRTGAEMLRAADELPAGLGRLTCPVLLLHGSLDGLTSPSGSQLVAERVSSSDVTLKVYDGLYHEVHNEPEKDTVLGDIVRWLDKHR